MTKVCGRLSCYFGGQPQPWGNFGKDKNRKDKLCPTCNSCRLEYRVRTKEDKKLYDIKFREKNYERINKEKNIYQIERRLKDLDFRIRLNLRARLCSAVKRGQKGGSAIKNLGCSIKDLKENFIPLFTFVTEENEMMSWNNYPRLWEIDHIIPLSAFDLTDPEQVKKAVHYSNLRPMYWKQNASEGDRGMSKNKLKKKVIK